MHGEQSIEEKMEGGDDGGVERVVDSKDLQQQSKALDKLTDRVEDRQLDSTRVQEVLSLSLMLCLPACQENAGKIKMNFWNL